MHNKILFMCDGLSQMNIPTDIELINDATGFIGKLPEVDLAIVHNNCAFSNEQIDTINMISEDKTIPIILYVDVDYSGLNSRQVKFCSLIREEDSVELKTMLINNILKHRRQTIDLLHDSELLDLFLKYNTSYVFFKDENARVLKLSQNYKEMLGIPAEEALGKNMNEIFPSELAESMVKDDLRILNEGETVEVVEELHGKFYKTSKFPIRREGKRPLLAGFTLDISDLKETERQLMESKRQVELLTVTDEMLDISNRRGFFSGLQNEISRIKRYGNPASLIIFDIDEFKNLNDTLGHFKADTFLKDVAEKVKEILRENDLFGRLGGDEFAILCVDTPIEKGIGVAERIRGMINNIPVIVDGNEYTYSISLGVTEVNEKHIEMEALLHKADLALYDAKQSGRNCIRVFEF